MKIKIKKTLSKQGSASGSLDNQGGKEFENDDIVIQSGFPHKDMLAGGDQAHSLLRKPKQVVKKRIVFEDVAAIGDEIALKLQQRKVPLTQIYQLLLHNSNHEEEVSIFDMENILRQHPFLLTNERDIEKVARYLIEDNFYERIKFDHKRTAPIQIIRSVMRKFLRYYEIPSAEEEDTMYRKIKRSIELNYLKLASDAASMKLKIGEYCSRDQFLNMFKQNDVYFDGKEVYFLLVKMLDANDDPKRIKFGEIFPLFEARKLTESALLEDENKPT